MCAALGPVRDLAAGHALTMWYGSNSRLCGSSWVTDHKQTRHAEGQVGQHGCAVPCVHPRPEVLHASSLWIGRNQPLIGACAAVLQGILRAHVRGGVRVL